MLAHLSVAYLLLVLCIASGGCLQPGGLSAPMEIDCSYCHPTNQDVLVEIQQLRSEFQQVNGSLLRCHPDISNQSCKSTAGVSGDVPGVPNLERVLHGNTTVLALELLDQELFVMRRNVTKVSVYDKTSFRLKRQIPVPGLGEASFGMAVCDVNNYLYVTDHWNHQIHVIDLSDDSIAARWNVSDRPGGVSVTRNLNVLVAYTWIKKIEEYTPTGTLVRDLSLNDMISRAVEMDVDTWLVASVGPNHRITAMRRSGQVIASYGSQPGSATGYLNYPASLNVDKKNGIVVFNEYYNSRVTFMNSSLSAVRAFPVPANVGYLSSPFGLTMDFSMGRLYVGEANGFNRVLMFGNVTNIGALFN